MNLTEGIYAYVRVPLASTQKEDEAKKTPREDHSFCGFSSGRLTQARSVHSRDLADSVMKGSISLDEALTQLQKRATS
jgi:hypothetical protein